MRVLAIAILATLCVVSPATAQFFDCTDPASAQAIDPAAPFSCVVLEEELAVVSAGFTPFRVVADVTSSEADLAPWLALVVATVKDNTAAWSQHYPLQLLPLTVVLFDPQDVATPLGNDLGRNRVHEGQCLMRLNTRKIATKGPEATLVFQRTVAHELAHCLQRSNWPAAALAEGNDWWLEGGADMLAGLLYPMTAEDLGQQFKFDAESAVVPLTQMSYEAATFFYWLWGKGPSLVFELMSKMPAAGGEAAQRSALLAFVAGEAAAAAIGPHGLDRFAEDYLDGNIHDPRGVVIVGPDLGAPTIFDATRSATFPSKPFTIQRALLGFIGDFALPTFDAYSTIYWRRADLSADWEEVSLFLDQESCELPLMYKVGRFPTTDSDHGFRLEANQTESCVLCTPTKQHDACLVGRWDVDLQAMTADLRQRIQSLSGLSDISGGIAFELRQDGKFTVAFDKLFIGGVAGDDDKGAAAWWLQIVGEDKGTWSAADGVLTFCIHETGSLMIHTVALSETQRYVTEHGGYAQSGVYIYTCGAKTELRYSGPIAMPPGYEPKWTLNKVK